MRVQPPSPLVSVSWLQTNLSNPQILLVDCRFSLADPQWGRHEYDLGHIPGAVYLDLNQDLASPPTDQLGRHPLPDLDQFCQRLTDLGFRFQETWVVAYDQARFAFGSRLWWLLRYVGHDRVALLDGGLQAWQGAGCDLVSWAGDRVLAEKQAQMQPGEGFVPQVRSHLTVNRDLLKMARPQDDVVVIDAREADRYRGDREPIDPIAGHIPGAVNRPWITIATEDGLMPPVPEQTAQWQDFFHSLSLATPEPKEIIVYCGSGVTACVNLLSLSLAGYDQAKLYPGGWSEWCRCEPV